LIQINAVTNGRSQASSDRFDPASAQASRSAKLDRKFKALRRSLRLAERSYAVFNHTDKSICANGMADATSEQWFPSQVRD
jgi:hypothetical protein